MQSIYSCISYSYETANIKIFTNYNFEKCVVALVNLSNVSFKCIRDRTSFKEQEKHFLVSLLSESQICFV